MDGQNKPVEDGWMDGCREEIDKGVMSRLVKKDEWRDSEQIMSMING